MQEDRKQRRTEQLVAHDETAEHASREAGEATTEAYASEHSANSTSASATVAQERSAGARSGAVLHAEASEPAPTSPVVEEDIHILLARQEAEIAKLLETQVALKKQLKAQTRAEEKQRRLEEKQAQARVRAEARAERSATRLAEGEAKKVARDAERQQRLEEKENLKLQRLEEKENLKLQRALEREVQGAGPQDDASANLRNEAMLSFLQATLRHAGVLGGHGVRFARRGGQAAGRASNQAIEFVDVDVRSQFKETPLLGLMQLLPHDPVSYRQTATEHPPLVMIHGLAGSSGNFAGMRLWLALHRPRPVHVFDYREHGDIFTASTAFEVWLDNVLSLYPEENVEILAHSMGGLLSRLALVSPERAARVSHLVTLGTPHHGTNLARWGGARFVRQLRMDSDVFQALRERESTPLPYALTSLWSKRDVMVLPPQQSIFEEKHSHEMSDSTHLGWLLHPRFMEEVFNIMDARRRHTLAEVSAAS